MPTGIPYCDKTWNPVVGCTPIAGGCKYCWAERLHNMRHKAWFAKLTDWTTCPKQYWTEFSEVQFFPDRLDKPLHWRKHRTIFVNSMSDTFHKDVPFEYTDDIFATMAMCPQHTFMVFTKRFARAAEYYRTEHYDILPNVHLFFSASTQAKVDEACWYLMQMLAAKRGLSLEPLLEDVRIPRIYCVQCGRMSGESHNEGCKYGSGGTCRCGAYLSYKDVNLDSIIVGCESGPNARLCKLDDIARVTYQCNEAGIPCFVKQIPLQGKCVKLTEKNKDQWPEWAVQDYPK